MLSITEKYYKALDFFNTNKSIESQKIYNLLLKAGKPSYIINSEPRSLTCLIISSVIGQKIRFTKAREIRGKLYTKLGVEFNVKDINKFNDWKQIGLEDFQINTIQELIKSHTNKIIDLENIKNIDKLLIVKGIGPWTIDNIKIMYMVANSKTVPDEILLHQDYIIKKALCKIYDITRISMLFIKKIKQSWVDLNTNESYIGIVNWYLWRYAPGIIY
jgi:3-methyladenine DNA glycosylase/8-oxoguanine DNA glycosylase